MQTQLQFIERKCIANRNHQFAVENELLLWQLRHVLDDIWKITRQRLAVLGLQKNLFPIAKHETAKPIPFRFILPLVTSRNFFDQTRFHRRQGWFQEHSFETKWLRRNVASAPETNISQPTLLTAISEQFGRFGLKDFL